ncbi:SpoIID/LytB domain-containing protein [Thermobrachium celere]|uniref:SpoIID/LytB domain-containing protein n=1 Tax=Thermobrachium celere TaxID=53422 RepID=UPI0019414A31|nr:SpoIID/LytB domain-containing protein [Thermobrachium celere]GFR35146.1 hypothetical protein TCEA9_09580 [Thermobrachium celere]
MKKIKRYLLFFIIITCILYMVYYFLFYKEQSIECGLVVSFKEKKKNYDVELFIGNDSKSLSIPKDKFNPQVQCYNIKFKGIFIKEITPAKFIDGTFNSLKGDVIEINDTKYSKEKTLSFIFLKDGKPQKVSKNFFVVGNSGYKYYFNSQNKIQLIVIESPPKLDTIRVGISQNNNSNYNHGEVRLYSKRGLELIADDQNYNIPKENKLQITFKKEVLVLNVLDKEGKLISKLLETNRPVKVFGVKNSLLYMEKQINNTSYIPTYPGYLEIKLNSEGFNIINVVQMEDYIRFVVPSEVPYSAGIEGYKAQAIAARTYAISDMLSGRFEGYGFHVDDSTLSQVYNSQPTNDLVKEAVQSTQNLVMTYKNKIIDAKYYSTSCGFGASYDEVWSDKTSKPYLTFNNFTDKQIKDLTNDVDALSFFKDWTVNAIDSASPYFRWKYTLSSKQLNTIINQNIYESYLNSPTSFKKKWLFNIYIKTKISPQGIGQIQDIYISKHTPSGLVSELTIISETGTYRIVGSRIIKKLVTPLKTMDKILLTRLRGEPIKNFESLPSAFFSIDREFKSNRLTSITIYGGGYGHGVGMSQYGLIESSRIGKDYRTILTTFYKDIEFADLNTIKIE